MPFAIPDTLKNEYEEYLTLLPLRKFAKTHKEAKIPLSKGRPVLIQGIEDFANTNPVNLEIVESWIDASVCCGKKDVYLKDLTDDPIDKLRDNTYLEEKFFGKIKTHRHISGNTYNESLAVCNYRHIDSPAGTVLRIILCKMINTFDPEGYECSRLYPVIANIYIDRKIIEIRVKPKANMFLYRNLSKDNAEDVHISTTSEKVATAALESLCEWLEIKIETNVFRLNEINKRRIYHLLESCIDIPDEIETSLDSCRDEFSRILSYFMQHVKSLTDADSSAFIDDIKTVFEKYIATTRTDFSIFIQNKRMYPVRLIASDADTSKVDQTSAGKKPLQSRPIFYNNKSMIYNNKRCDGIQFYVKKDENISTSQDYFLTVKSMKGYCNLSWNMYIDEDEVDYVLLRIIDLY